MKTVLKRMSLAAIILGAWMLLQFGAPAHAEKKDDPLIAAICTRGLRVGVSVQGPKNISFEGDTSSPTPVAAYPPYLIPVSRDGAIIRAEGLDIDILSLVARKFKCPTAFQEAAIQYSDFPSLYDRLRNRQSDFIIAGIGLDYPLEARHGLSYSLPYNERSGIALAAPPREADEINACLSKGHNLTNRLGCLKGKSIYTIKDSIQDGTKLQEITGIEPNFDEFPKPDLKEVLTSATSKSSGSVVMLDYPALNYLIHDSVSSPGIYGWRPLTVNPYAGGDDRYLLMKTGDVVAVRSSDIELLKIINHAISEARLDGTLKRIQDKWLGPAATDPANPPMQNESAAAASSLIRNMRDAGDVPPPLKVNIELGGSGDFVLNRKADKDVGAHLKLSWDVPRFIQSDWPWWRRGLVNPIFGLDLFDQAGINTGIEESGSSTPDVDMTVTQDISLGGFWRAHLSSSSNEEKLSPWLGFGVNMNWKKSTTADKTAPKFESSNTFAVTFVPSIGAAVPIGAKKVSVQPSVSLDKALMTSGHPTPTLKFELGIELKLD